MPDKPAGGPIGDEEESWTSPVPNASVIRLMGEHTVTVPLWSEQDGLIFSEPRELIEAFGLSRALAKALETWAVAWEARAGELDHDAEAARLVRRLNSELKGQHLFVYRP